MVKPEIFDIFFDDHHRVYQPGQHVSGCVELQLSKEIKARGVFLTIYGGADTHWTEQETHAHHSHGRHSRSGSRSVTVHYRSREVYIDSSVMLWGNGNAQMIPPGRYSLPFSVCLPHLCLPSFQGSMGKIQYYCQAKIDRPWRFDHKVKEMFTVLTIYDLNLSPMTAVGVSAEDSKSLGCCCCVDGTVYFQANIPKTGFVPGECIKVNLHLDNRSNRPMHSFEIYLLQVVSYTAAREGIGYEHRKNESRKISGVTENLDEIQVPSQYSVTRDIPIPAVVATMGNNSIVQVQYVVECKLVPTGLSTSRKIQLPLIVGTVPLLLLPTAPLFDSGNAFPSDLPPAFSTVQPLPAEPPPPSYEECMFGRVDARNDEDNEHTRGNLAFAPKYPVYRF